MLDLHMQPRARHLRQRHGIWVRFVDGAMGAHGGAPETIFNPSRDNAATPASHRTFCIAHPGSPNPTTRQKA